MEHSLGQILSESASGKITRWQTASGSQTLRWWLTKSGCRRLRNCQDAQTRTGSLYSWTIGQKGSTGINIKAEWFRKNVLACPVRPPFCISSAEAVSQSLIRV